MSPHLELGQYGETFVSQVLSEVGNVSFDSPSDLSFMGCNIEVKSSRPSKYNGSTFGYQFLLRKKDKHGVTDFRKADVVILLCFSGSSVPAAVFVVPSDVFGDRQKVTVPLSLNSWLAPYRDRWEIISKYID